MEELMYIAIVGFFSVTYIYVGLVLRPYSRKYVFGFSQLWNIGWQATLISYALLFFMVPVYLIYSHHIKGVIRKIQNTIYSKPQYVVSIAILCATIFFLLRSNFLNPDAEKFTTKFHSDVSTKGAHVTHDEMWEFYVHSRFWFYANHYFGWSVPFSYQVLSSIAGGVFIFILLKLCQHIIPKQSIALVLINISGGYVQLLFGDVENYTLTSVFIVGYFFSSYLYTREQQHIVVPSLILGIAMTFHLLAGFLLPSLVFLYFREIKKRHYSDIAFGISCFVCVIGFTLLFFHHNNLPITDLFYHSHAFGRGGHILRMLVTPTLGYYVEIVNLLFLLAPISILLIPLVCFRRIPFDAFNVHLIIATVFMLFFMCIWNAGLGVYNDWNLFANVAIPISLLVGSNVLRLKTIRFRSEILILLTGLFFLHSHSWIIGNHFSQ